MKESTLATSGFALMAAAGALYVTPALEGFFCAAFGLGFAIAALGHWTARPAARTAGVALSALAGTKWVGGAMLAGNFTSAWLAIGIGTFAALVGAAFLWKAPRGAARSLLLMRAGFVVVSLGALLDFSKSLDSSAIYIAAPLLLATGAALAAWRLHAARDSDVTDASATSG